MSFKLLEKFLVYDKNKEDYSLDEREIIRNEFRKELGKGL
jgi:hypothetical protein